MSHIRVNNYLDEAIRASVNQWGRGANTSCWTLSAASAAVPTDESWEREDRRGFILTIATKSAGDADVPYFVHSGADIEVKSDGIVSDGVAIDPVGSIPPDDDSDDFTLSVSNAAAERISVSINQWGKHGNTSDRDVKSGDTETWEREDRRGFVMTLLIGGGPTRCYYVHRDSVIVASADKVTDRGKAIGSIGMST